MSKTKRPHRFTEPCEACNGDGTRDDAPEARGESWSPIWTGGGDFSTECSADGCDEGRVPCPGIPEGPDGATWTCAAQCQCPDADDPTTPCVCGAEPCDVCDGRGTVDCEMCDGTGRVDDTCGACGDVLSDDDTAYVGDGEMRCPACVDLTCPDCAGEGETPIPAEIPTPGASDGDARRWAVVDRSCSMCAGSPHNHDDRVEGRSWCHVGQSSTYGYTSLVVRAGLCDSDGVYYAALCAGDGSPDPDTCLSMVLAQQSEVPEERSDRLAALTDAMPGEGFDGIESEMADTL